MGRKKLPPKPTITFRMSQDINDKLWAVASETKKSINTLILEAVEERYGPRK